MAAAEGLKHRTGQDTHLVRQFEKPAARDVHVVVRSVAVVTGGLVGFAATNSSLGEPHTPSGSAPTPTFRKGHGV